jgi:hypothetical protein
VQFHRARQVVLQADPHADEAAVCRTRLGVDEFDFAALSAILQLEVFFQSVVAGEERGGRRAERPIELSDDDLVEIRVVDPQLFAVADDGLRMGLLVGPACRFSPRSRTPSADRRRKPSRDSRMP